MKKELKEKLRKWNECLKDKGLKTNEDKTKVIMVNPLVQVQHRL